MLPDINECRIIELPRISAPNGNLTSVESGSTIPFDIKRVYYIYDVPGGEGRGAHAHKSLQQILVAAMGAFEVVLDDGKNKKTVRLERAYQGLYIPKLIWRELVHFSSGVICLVLASLPYDESEYLRSYPEFLEERARTSS